MRMKVRALLAGLFLCALGVCGTAFASTYGDLAAAVKAGDQAKVTALLDAGLSPNVAGTDKQSPVLVIAVVLKNQDMARLLLAHGADPNARHATYYNATALMMAANNRDAGMVKLLLDAGANVNLTDKAGDSALNWTTFFGDEAIAEMLLAHKIDATLYGHGNALQVALRRGHQKLVERYVDYLGLRQTVKLKERPLFEAVAEGSGAKLRAALGGGAYVNAKDSTGRSALGLAGRMGNVKMIEALAAAGARLDSEDPIGFTPLMEAARDGHIEAATKLIELGADVAHRAKASGLELSPLHLATAGGHGDLVRLLVARGADINARDAEQATALMWAINQQPAVALQLVQMGADPDIASNTGDTPRALAEQRKMTALIEAIAAQRAKQG
jgi:ankyrin repeat protein